MAIKLKDNRYLKVNLDKCFATFRGMFVSYSQYPNTDERILEIQRLEDVDKFEKTLYSDLYKKRQFVENYLIEHNIKTEEEYKNVPKHIREIVDILESIDYDIETIKGELYIKTGVESIDITKLKNYNYLKELGLNDEWFTKKLNPPTNITSISSAYTGQKFTYNSMYNELKKLFKKDGFTDC